MSVDGCWGWDSLLVPECCADVQSAAASTLPLVNSLPFGPFHPTTLELHSVECLVDTSGLSGWESTAMFAEVASQALGILFNLVAALSDQERVRRVCALKTRCISWLTQIPCSVSWISPAFFLAWFLSYPWSYSQGYGSIAPEWAQVRDVVCTPVKACV